ncbi:MAG: hypothetical protein FWF52_01095 [Candidatus Azobacteroides sp.]|nr:hypothetical protein [Candidatus Azobacteroides sp.]
MATKTSRIQLRRGTNAQVAAVTTALNGEATITTDTDARNIYVGGSDGKLYPVTPKGYTVKADSVQVGFNSNSYIKSDANNLLTSYGGTNGSKLQIGVGGVDLSCGTRKITITSSAIYINGANASSSDAPVSEIYGKGSTEMVTMTKDQVRSFVGIDLSSTEEQLTGDTYNGKPVYTNMVTLNIPPNAIGNAYRIVNFTTFPKMNWVIIDAANSWLFDGGDVVHVPIGAFPDLKFMVDGSGNILTVGYSNPSSHQFNAYIRVKYTKA